MASLKGLPPLPKSLSGLLSFSSAQRKEMERIHAMRTMIQQDLSRSSQQQANPTATELQVTATDKNTQSPTFQNRNVRKTSTLDVQLALLRKEMVGLRQLDMSLLCQLWSLNESLLEYKHLLMEDRLSHSLSQNSSPGWDNGFDRTSSCDEDEDEDDVLPQHQSSRRQRRRRCNLQLVEEDVLSSMSSSTSHSSLEFGDV